MLKLFDTTSGITKQWNKIFVVIMISLLGTTSQITVPTYLLNISK